MEKRMVSNICSNEYNVLEEKMCNWTISMTYSCKKCLSAKIVELNDQFVFVALYYTLRR